jgi:hypothetical protein
LIEFGQLLRKKSIATDQYPRPLQVFVRQTPTRAFPLALRKNRKIPTDAGLIVLPKKPTNSNI